MLQLIGIDLRFRKDVAIPHQAAKPFQGKEEDAVRFHAEFLQELRIALFLRHSMLEAQDDKPAVKSLGAVAVVLRDAVA